MTTDEALGHARAALQRATSGSTRSMGTGEAIEVANVLEAALQALADVRTLDEWAHDNKKPATCVPVVDMGGNWRVYLTHAVSFLGVTADEARSKAAAWVRGLK